METSCIYYKWGYSQLQDYRAKVRDQSSVIRRDTDFEESAKIS